MQDELCEYEWGVPLRQVIELNYLSFAAGKETDSPIV